MKAFRTARAFIPFTQLVMSVTSSAVLPRCICLKLGWTSPSEQARNRDAICTPMAPAEK